MSFQHPASEEERCPASGAMNMHPSKNTGKPLGICIDCNAERRLDRAGRPYPHFRPVKEERP